jgi:diguanylate cyclase (GGDEF)-like protein
MGASMPSLRRLPDAARTVLPFVGIVALAFAASALRTAGTNWWLVAGAAAGAAAVAAVAFALPWARFPAFALLALPFATDGVIVVLRQAQGGSTSGYAPLAILPVAWVGLTQRRSAVAAMSVSTALMFGLPIAVIGSPMYPATGWRGVILWTVVAAVMGMGANRVVAEQRRQTRLSRAHAVGLDRLVHTQTAIATADLDLAGLMSTAAEGALALTAADGACIELRSGAEIVCAGAAGLAAGFVGLRLRTNATITGECFRTGEVLICPDSEEDPRVDRDACRLAGARSLIVVPLLHGGDMKGVLLVYSATPGTFRSDEAQLLALLANMLGAALVRAELMEKLSDQAVTDELTGLPNRRAWYFHLDQALARAARTGRPLSILILDLDRFKRVNDEDGHVAGDRLLKSVTSAWTGELRATDVLGRIGGDEFAVILEHSDAEAACDVVARLDDALTVGHRASTGVAVWDGSEDATAFVARADADMYSHKKARSARA